MDDSANKILAELRFGISGAEKDLVTLQQRAEEVALATREAFNKPNIAPGLASTDAAMQSSLARTTAYVQKAEAEKTAAVEKAALARQEIIRSEAQAELLAVQQAAEQEKIAYKQARKATFNENTGSFGNLITRHASWAISGGAVLGAFELIKTSVSDVSASMTKLKQVLEIVPPYDKSPQKLADDLKELQEVAGVMATAYGVDFSQVLDVMSQAGRRFKDVASIISATDTALQLVVVDAVPVGDSIAGVEAIMSQFGLTTGEAKQAMYEISAAAHELQVTAPTLIQAIERSGSAFKTMKMNTAESVAAIATLSQMTAAQGGMIGNTWKSLEASMASDKGQKALKELGVALFDANGQITDSAALLVGLQDKWKGLSDQAKMHYAQVLAGGKYQYQRLQAFLDDYTGAYQKALAGIETANADMQKKLVESAMTSLPQQLKMTWASLQVLTAELTTEATPALIMFLTSVRGGITDLKDHKEELEKILATGVKLAEGYIAWKIAIYAYTAVTTNATIQTTAMQASLLKLELTGRGVPATMAGIAGGIGAVGAMAVAVAKKVGILLIALAAFNRLANMATDPEGEKITSLETELKAVNAKIGGYNPKANLSAAGTALKEWHPITALDQLTDAAFGWEPGGESQEYLIEKRDSLQQQYDDAVAAKKQAEEEALKKDLDNLDQLMAKYEEEANAKTQDMLKNSGIDPNNLIGLPDGGGSSKSKEWVQAYLDSILYAAEAQAKLEQALQRSVDSEQAMIGLHTESAMTLQEYAAGLKEQTGLLGLYEKQQGSMHAEADAYRQAITLLEAKQKTLNTSTDEGKEAYDKIGDEIENCKQKVDELGKSYVELEGKQRALYGLEVKGVLDKLSSIKDLGVDVNELEGKYLSSVNLSNLELSDRIEILKKIEDYVSNIVTAEIDKQIQAIKDKQKIEDAASEAKQASIQAEIDAINKENDELETQKQLESDLLAISKAQQDLTDAQNKLNNVESEKNTRIFQNGAWTYIADPQDVKDAQDAVDDANDALLDAKQTYYDELKSIEEQAYLDELQAQIDTEKERQEDQDNYYSDQITALEAQKDNIVQSMLAGGDAFKETLTTIFTDKLTPELTTQLDTMASLVNQYVQDMLKSLEPVTGETGITLGSTSSDTPKVEGANAIGGPIGKTGLYLDHAGEYMLNAADVTAMGGYAGVEAFRSSLKAPKISGVGSVSSISSTSSSNTDNSVNLNGPISFPNVYDWSGMARQLKSMSKVS